MKGDPNVDTATDHSAWPSRTSCGTGSKEGRDLVSSERPTTRIYEVLYRLSWTISGIEWAKSR